MTEGVSPFSATVRGDWRHESSSADVFASSGRAFPTARIRSVDPQGNELGPDEEGELVVESEILFSGYLDDPQKTSEVMTPLGFATGDLGRIDAGGYVYVVGRKKELIITGGMNVYPAEIEPPCQRTLTFSSAASSACPTNGGVRRSRRRSSFDQAPEPTRAT